MIKDKMRGLGFVYIRDCPESQGILTPFDNMNK